MPIHNVLQIGPKDLKLKILLTLATLDHSSAAKTLDELATLMSRGSGNMKVIEKQDKNLDEMKSMWKVYLKKQESPSAQTSQSSSHLGSSLSSSFYLDL